MRLLREFLMIASAVAMIGSVIWFGMYAISLDDSFAGARHDQSGAAWKILATFIGGFICYVIVSRWHKRARK